MALMLVLSLAVIPVGTIAISIAQSDLAAALDDWHYYKAEQAAQGILNQLEKEVVTGEAIQINWPDAEISFQYQVTTYLNRWEIIVTITSGRAKITRQRTVQRQS